MMTPLQAFCAFSSGISQQLQDDRLVFAEHFAGGDAEQQGVADFRRRRRNGDSARLLDMDVLRGVWREEISTISVIVGRGNSARGMSLTAAEILDQFT